MDQAPIVNNLTNITLRNPVYLFWAKRVLEGQRTPKGVEQRLAILGGDAFFLHYSLYPHLRERNPDPFLNAILQALKKYAEGEEYRKIRAVTRLNDFLSLLFARRFVHHLLINLENQKLLSASGEGERGRQEGQEQEGQGKEKGQEREEQGRQEGKRGEGQAPPASGGFSMLLGGWQLPPSQVERAAAAALAKAVKDVDDVKELSDILGKGAGKTPAPLEKMVSLAERILDVSWAVDILSLAREIEVPHFVHLMRVKERRGDEVAGFRRTLRLDRALPRELALDDDLFYAKIASGGLLSREYFVTREGAYYVLIDRSGSMAGEKTVWARSVALALFKLARARGRKYFLRFFDSDVHPAHFWAPLSAPLEVVEHILTVAPRGGTAIDYALSVAANDLHHRELREKANTVIIITDGEDEVTTQPAALQGARLVAVMTKGHNPSLQQLAIATGGEYLRVTPDPRGGKLVVKAAAER
ncbi:MAG: VWA domain-containing protein [Thermofilaceae archaeon]